ncbi:peptidase, M23 family [Leptospira broomii serovar Hurstbridge str. 5399]|uniref:Peptidase, M23 family n=1 Tax=Leptospira broomii serovar Hurstbridge str. 5399 TaxID=1049789 RepID=T0GG82_9LEPT|nr:M23 family metallopeptidase [Leptospira broomii]EQA45859.1 peptidase, M23 family [Leptospira broomii serovar Hurstbridge str. 5399]
MRNGILAFLLFSLFLWSPLIAETIEYCDSKNVCYTVEPGLFDGSIFLQAKGFPSDAFFTIYLVVSGSNVSTDPKTPISIVLHGSERKKAIDLIKIDPALSITPRVEFVSYFGKLNAIHDDSYVYHLPYEGKSWISVGYNSGNEHRGDAMYSLDFYMPEGTAILAARDGTVVETEDRFSVGKIDPTLIDKANRVIIAHSDGTVAIYGHLKKDGVLVKPGDRVVAGSKIGFSGNTGYSSGPHLHFEVYRPEENRRKKTFPTLFKTESGDAEFLTEENAYWQMTEPKFPGFPITDLDKLCFSEIAPVAETNSSCLDQVSLKKKFYVTMPIYKTGPYVFEAELFVSGQKKPTLTFSDKIPAGVTSVSWEFPPQTVKGKYSIRIRMNEIDIGTRIFQILP